MQEPIIPFLQIPLHMPVISRMHPQFQWNRFHYSRMHTAVILSDKGHHLRSALHIASAPHTHHRW